MDEKKTNKSFIKYLPLNFPLSSASPLKANAYIRVLLNRSFFSPSFALAHTFGLIELRRFRKRHCYRKYRLNDRSDVPGARSISPTGRSSPSPRLRPPPTGSPAISGNSPFAPPRRERREDPSMIKKVTEHILAKIFFYKNSF